MNEMPSFPFPGVMRIYCLGICGAGMRVLAKLLALSGYEVRGSDNERGEGALALSLSGIPVLPPSDSSIIDADLVLYSAAIQKSHPQLSLARRRGIPTLGRAEALGLLMQGYRCRIGVAGAHGKSTVSAMVTEILREWGVRPTAAIGASLPGQGDGLTLGGRDFFVFEACEYRRAFLAFCPTVAVLLNAEHDHPDCYATEGEAEEAFFSYLTLPSVEARILNAEDARTDRFLPRLGRATTFGVARGDMTARRAGNAGALPAYELLLSGEGLGRFTLSVPGRHNLENALAAASAAYAVGCPAEAITRGLSGFRGIGRRLTVMGEREGVLWIDDYAHHPTEIRASLSAVRPRGGRLFCLFQSHTYSRSRAFLPAFGEALAAADLTIVTEVYAAREEKGETGGREIAQAVTAAGGRAEYAETPEEAAARAVRLARAGDTVIVMGAGDIGERVFSALGLA